MPQYEFQQESIIQDTHFRPVSEVRVDSKNRIHLPKCARSAAARMYKLLANDSGQLVLDPLVTIPASEAWLFKNKKALAAVRHGLQDAKEGKLVRRPSLSKHADDKIE